MDPDFYKRMNHFMTDLPPRIPIPMDSSAQDSQALEPMDSSAQAKPTDTDWTVYSMNVTRGNLGNAKYLDDPRMSFGWKEDSAATRAKQMPWMSIQNRQPFMASGELAEKDDEATPRVHDATGPSSSYPHPSLSLPHPSLSLDFRMAVSLNDRISVGPTPFGHRNWISFSGGSWSGSWGSGIVLPGGQDSQIIIPDGSARLETNYILQTYDDPAAHIVVKTHGWRTGPPEVLAQLTVPEIADKVDPRSYKFRIFIEMETGDERYRDKVNCGMWVGSGMRRGFEVVYDAYRVA